MVELLRTNYEWIFSGIGVLLISLFFGFKKKKRPVVEKVNSYNSGIENSNIKVVKSDNVQIIGTQVQNNYEIAKDEGFDFVDIDPTIIKERIRNSPLFQQEEMSNHYIGLKIKWTLRLFIIFKREGNLIEVSMLPINSSYPDVNFEVNIERYPIFKISEADKKFEITGKIIKCGQFHIDIDVETITELK